MRQSLGVSYWRRAAISVLLMLAFSPAASLAQVVLPASNPPAPPPPAPGWDNPQDSVSSFIQDMRTSNFWEARKAMDLSDVAFPVRNTQGSYDAQLLTNILSRINGFQPGSLPTAPKSATVSIPVQLRDGKVVGKLDMQKVDGAWVFTSSTVAALPRLYEAVQYQPQSNSIGQFAPPPPDPSMLIRPYVPRFLAHSFLWMEIWQWLGLLALTIAAMFLAFLIRVLVRVVVHLFLRRWSSILTPGTSKSIRRSLGLWGGVMLWERGYPYLGLGQATGMNLLITVILKLFIAGSFAWVVDSVFDIVMDAISARASTIVRRADQILIPIAKKFMRFLIFSCAALAFAAMMSVNVTGLVTGLGIGGLVLALAGKDSVENIFGSLTIIFDQPFGVGDYIKFANAEGTVEEINLRSTRIRTMADTVVTVPNSNLITAAVENFGARRYRRTLISLPISYTTSPTRIEGYCNAVRQLVQGNPKINHDMTYVDLDSADSTNLTLKVQAYFSAETYREELNLREDLIRSLMKTAVDAKVILGPILWGGINAPSNLMPESPQETQPQ